MILSLLKERFRQALEGLVDQPEPYLDQIRPTQNPAFGDFQANMAMPLAKVLSQPPRQVAQHIIDRLQFADFLEVPEIAGAGFINLRLKNNWLANKAGTAAGDARLGVPVTTKPETIVVDYSSPNVAKPMHVGHIRSTVIGNAIGRVLRFLGHRVIADNHLGDWGTQFGMIIYGFRNFCDENVFEENPVCELGRLYRLVRQLMDYHSAVAALKDWEVQACQAQAKLDAQRACVAALKESNAKKDERKKAESICSRLKDEADRARERFESGQKKINAVENDPVLKELAASHTDINAAVLHETALLHQGNADNIELWKRFLPECIKDINAIYDEFGVTFDTTLGESFYHPFLGKLVDKLLADGVARESDGAICIFVEGQPVPMIIRKKDGAFLYATTDLATIAWREEQYHPDRILYVVDTRQSLHFQQLFTVAKQLGYKNIDFVHVNFGTILGDDGRPFKTRSGDTVGLSSLLDEAKSRAYDIVCAGDKDGDDTPRFTQQERREIASVVGIGALVYSDLSQNRESDYVFSYDRMLAMNGNTAAYMQYACARVRSIFSRGEIDVKQLEKDASNGKIAIVLTEPQERALALELLKFADALNAVAKDYRPNQLTSYLYELANCYSAFFEKCPVLRATDNAVRTSRLLLCDLTAKTIEKGLDLLGIKTVERM